MSKPSDKIFDLIFPKDLPNSLFIILIVACLLLGLSSLRHGTDLQSWLNVIENWLLMLLIFPTATATVALPFKYRDPSLELKLMYYLGMFVAFLFTLAKLRYWR
ncbi:MAG: hypothetical protein ACTH4C_09430 [Psychrobacter celer]|uniref:hypothetical protein n=1 Tax=Psychrobacter TaxID=497 RepID=UPI000C2B4880|nr:MULTISPECIES: hypothetical protein [unclassified Psychrobacter]MDE0491224.1 hypothetical protein [Psychrobacter sp. A3]MDN5619558.1 hypothetical protein [Psychrobacter sp.]PJX21321.1 hypothetical protein CAP50_10565 [Psychrobacter sp. L7]